MLRRLAENWPAYKQLRDGLRGTGPEVMSRRTLLVSGLGTWSLIGHWELWRCGVAALWSCGVAELGVAELSS